MSDLAAKIRQAVRNNREYYGMSIRELAKRSDVSPTTITNIEAGKPARLDKLNSVLLQLGLIVELRGIQAERRQTKRARYE